MYTVRKGDTLWDIANRYLGGGQNWRQLYNYGPNKGTVGANPNLILPGQQLQLPNGGFAGVQPRLATPLVGQFNAGPGRAPLAGQPDFSRGVAAAVAPMPAPPAPQTAFNRPYGGATTPQAPVGQQMGYGGQQPVVPFVPRPAPPLPYAGLSDEARRRAIAADNMHPVQQGAFMQEIGRGSTGGSAQGGAGSQAGGSTGRTGGNDDQSAAGTPEEQRQSEEALKAAHSAYQAREDHRAAPADAELDQQYNADQKAGALAPKWLYGGAQRERFGGG